MSTRHVPVRLRAEARGPFRALLAALTRLDDEGRATPCQLNPTPFVSDDRAERTAAAAACALCPTRRLCTTYAQAQRERFGVWGGRDRTPQPITPRRT